MEYKMEKSSFFSLKNIPIKYKIFLSPALGIITLSVVGLIFFSGLVRQKNTINYLVDQSFAFYQNSLIVANRLTFVHSNLYRILVMKSSGYEEDKISKLIDFQNNEIDNIVNKINLIIDTPGLSDQDKNFFKQSLDSVKLYKEHMNTGFNSMKLDDIPTATILLDLADQDFQSCNDNLGTFIKKLEDKNKILLAKSNKSINRFIFFTMLLIILSIIILTIVSFVISFRIMKPINNTSVVMKDISEGEGDLSVQLHVETNDEIGKMGSYFNTFVSRIRDIISEVKELTANFTTVSEMMANKTYTFSGSTQNQASSIEEMNATIEEISAEIEAVSASTKD
jgi:methyl-accepting chemotaxis protein